MAYRTVILKLLKLKSLNVDFNPIGDVPQEIIKLKSLEEFTCTSTNLEGNSLVESLPSIHLKYWRSPNLKNI